MWTTSRQTLPAPPPIDESCSLAEFTPHTKDDTGGCVVFTQQGASASHVTATKVPDTVAWLPGMSGKQTMLFPHRFQVKMSDASRLLKRPETECPTLLSGSLETVVQNIGITSMTQCFHWNAIYKAIRWQDCDGKEDRQKSLCKKKGKKYPAGNVFMFPNKLSSSFHHMSTT